MANSRSTDLPQPTRNLNTATKNLNEFGYCLVTDALSSVEIDALRTRLIEQATAETAKYEGVKAPGDYTMYNIVVQQTWENYNLQEKYDILENINIYFHFFSLG